MKYQLNEDPSYSAVPVIELKPGSQGVVKCAALYGDETWLHKLDPGIRAEWDGSTEVLAGCSDHSLMLLSMLFIYPIEELQEIRELEIQYRSSKGAVSP